MTKTLLGNNLWHGSPLVCITASSTLFLCQFGGHKGQWAINSSGASESEASLLALLRHIEQREAAQIIHYSSCWQDVRSRDEGPLSLRFIWDWGQKKQQLWGRGEVPFCGRDASKGTLSPILLHLLQRVDDTANMLTDPVTLGCTAQQNYSAAINNGHLGIHPLMLLCPQGGPQDVPQRATLAFHRFPFRYCHRFTDEGSLELWSKPLADVCLHLQRNV